MSPGKCSLAIEHTVLDETTLKNSIANLDFLFKILKNTFSKSKVQRKFQKSMKYVVKDSDQSQYFGTNQEKSKYWERSIQV